MYTRRRVDANHKDIVEALRDAGAHVLSLAPLGHGVPDLLVAYAGRMWLLEIKNPFTHGKLNQAQEQFLQDWGSVVRVVHTAYGALRVIGAQKAVK